MPVHPRTRAKLAQLNFDFTVSSIHFIDPVGYFDMIYLISQSECVVTDSGGLQKEAFFFGKHCLVTRVETEWVELVEGGFNFICGSDPEVLVARFEALANLKAVDFKQPLYGDGNAGQYIVEAMTKFLMS